MLLATDAGIGQELLDVEQTSLAERNAMAVAGEILHHGVDLLDPGLAVDHPVGLHQRIQALRHLSPTGR